MLVRELTNSIAELVSTGSAHPASGHRDFHRHIFRELNRDADAKASLAHKRGNFSWAASNKSSPAFLRVFFDCSMRAISRNQCTAAMVAFASDNPGPSDDNWAVIASQSYVVHADSVLAAELEGAAGAHHFISLLYRDPCRATEFHSWTPRGYR